MVWSSPIWEQPKGWTKEYTPSTRPSNFALASLAKTSEVLFTQPTVLTIQISLRMPTSPFLRTNPMKVASWRGFSSLRFGL
ncbi:hypothetical protein D3C72_2173240 [compost metagenome]